MIGHDAKRWPLARLAGLAAVALSGVASLGAQPVSAAECSIPQRNRAAILAGVERAMSCAEAQEILHACASSTSGDVALADAVVAKCEKLFAAGLSPVDRAEYNRQKKACAKKHAMERGTESVSLAARCKAGVAAEFAK